MAIMKRTAIAAAVRLAMASAQNQRAAVAAVARETLLPDETVEACCARCHFCFAVLTEEEEEAGDGVCEPCERLDEAARLDDVGQLIDAGCAGSRGQS